MNGIPGTYKTASLKQGDEVFLNSSYRAGVVSIAQRVSREGEKCTVMILNGPRKGNYRTVFDCDIDWEKGVKHNA